MAARGNLQQSADSVSVKIMIEHDFTPVIGERLALEKKSGDQHIDTAQHYPIVIKSCASRKVLENRIKEHAEQVYAEQVYGVTKIVNRYMQCIAEIINIPTLVEKFKCIADKNRTDAVIDEILKQSRMEFNHAETST